MPKKIDRPQEFTFSIVKQLGLIGTTSTGWTKEVNLVEWNGNPAKLDVRDWDPNHEHMGKGITLHKPETLALLEILLRNFGKDLAKAMREAEAEVTAAAEAAEAAEEPVMASEINSAQEDLPQESLPACDEDGVCQEEPW